MKGMWTGRTGSDVPEARALLLALWRGMAGESERGVLSAQHCTMALMGLRGQSSVEEARRVLEVLASVLRGSSPGLTWFHAASMLYGLQNQADSQETLLIMDALHAHLPSTETLYPPSPPP
eukprot:Hpha_TRINITY_DN7274_c0_g1::TRINITY_DN7274_c0_g1_i1::g.102233::m.102233